MRAREILFFVVVLFASLALAALVGTGCACGNLPQPPAPDLAPHPCIAPAPLCHFVDGGVTPCNLVVDGAECYTGHTEEPRCLPDPRFVPAGYPYYVVGDCSLCITTCALTVDGGAP